MKPRKTALTNEILSDKFKNQFFLVNKAIQRAERIVMFEQTHGSSEVQNPVLQVLDEMEKIDLSIVLKLDTDIETIEPKPATV